MQTNDSGPESFGCRPHYWWTYNERRW